MKWGPFTAESQVEGFKRRGALAFWSILLLGLLLRIAWVGAVDTLPEWDFLAYHQGAVSLAAGHGYAVNGKLTAFMPVGYPAFLAMLYYLFSPQLWVAKVANILVSGATLVLVYFTARLYFSRSTALLAMCLAALLPRSIAYTSVISTELVFTTAFVFLNYLMLTDREARSSAMLQGILTGLLALTKPFMMAYPLAILAIAYSATGDVRSALRKTALATAFMIVTIAPWTIRNYLVFRKFVPISTNGGLTLFINNNDHSTGAWQDPFTFFDNPFLRFGNQDGPRWKETEVDRLGRDLALSWILDHPLRFARLGIEKLRLTFLCGDDTDWATAPTRNGFKYGNLVFKINAVAHKAMLAGLLLYLVIVTGNTLLTHTLGSLHKVMLINTAFFMAVVFVFEGQPRYAVPLLPFFMIMCAFSVYWIGNAASAGPRGSLGQLGR
jgi:4-amino-4-deoxy-L-arabinose transferase-like glycosyltransferase